VAKHYRKIIAIVMIKEQIVRIKGVRNRAVHIYFPW